MARSKRLNDNELVELKKLYKELLLSGICFERTRRKEIQRILNEWMESLDEDFIAHPIMKIFRTMIIVQKEMGLGHAALSSILLYRAVNKGTVSEEKVKELFGENTAAIIVGLNKVYDLYNRNMVVESENFRKLLLSFAENLQVILIILAERLDTMRSLAEYPAEQQEKIAYEASYLYAPLAHRIGLYGIKTELEDLSLKYTARDTYKEIALGSVELDRGEHVLKLKIVKSYINIDWIQFRLAGNEEHTSIKTPSMQFQKAISAEYRVFDFQGNWLGTISGKSREELQFKIGNLVNRNGVFLLKPLKSGKGIRIQVLDK